MKTAIAVFGALLALAEVRVCSTAWAVEIDAEFFEARVRPILFERCSGCHSNQAESVKGELWLDSRDGLLAGGETGPVIELDAPDQSRLLEAIRYADPSLQMPPQGKLPGEEIAILERWVRAGAPWSDQPAPAARAPRNSFNLAEREAAHWCWRPIESRDLPSVADAAWPQDPLDQFVLSGLETQGLHPAPPASKRQLIRRLYFDLIGLPPSPEEVARFLADESPEAVERVVDALLASHHFGERWARHWLDLVRYAETRGHEFDYGIPNAWAYRDYVIRAFNADLPYDQFVVEHIAGDLLSPPRLDTSGEINESLVATCAWFLGEWVHSPVDIRADETDRVANQIDVVTKAFLGLTVACARCHDHKFDAISTRDYYALAGFLHSSSAYERPFQHIDHNRRHVTELQRDEDDARRAVAAILRAKAEPVMERLAHYLLAVRQLAEGEPQPGTPVPHKQIETVAAAHQLDAAVLEAWWRETRAARTDAFALLRPWADVALDRAEATPLRIVELMKPSVDAWTAEAVRASQAMPHQPIVDYACLQPGEWITSGLGFGTAPEPALSWRVGGGIDQPIEGVASLASARLQVADSRLPSMVRTPTFVIESPTLHYQVAGEGTAFVVVDSYRLLEGPLHGSLRKSFKSGDDFSWQVHEVRDYVGHRAHIEFTPGPLGTLRVARVTQGGPAEADACRAPRLVLRALTSAPIETLEELASRYARLLACGAEVLTSPLEGESPAADASRVTAERPEDGRAGVAQWLRTRLDLLGYDAGARRAVTDVLGQFTARRAAVSQSLRASPVVMAMVDGTPFDEHVLIRGNHRTPGEEVPRRFLEALDGRPIDASGTGAGSPVQRSPGGGRLALAHRFVDPANPLLARVYVNRIWQHLVGRGIVATVDNFGVLGERPTHPELLDYLSRRFQREGWSTKTMIRAIVRSATYQMSSAASPADERDPANRWFHKGPIKRLEGEPLRDAILAVSGRLDRTAYGPSVPIHLTSFMAGRGRPGESGPMDGNGRRSVYIAQRRNFLPPMMLAFDMPVPLSTMGRRNASNVPAQALILLNDPLISQQARHWAEQVVAHPGDSAEARIVAMYERAFARPPTDDETHAILAFLDQQAEVLALPAGERDRSVLLWAELAHVLFNSKEFYFIE